MSAQYTPIATTPPGLDEGIAKATKRVAFVDALNAKIQKALELRLCPHCHGTIRCVHSSEWKMQNTYKCHDCHATIIQRTDYISPGTPMYRTCAAPQFDRTRPSAFAEIIRELEEEYGIMADKTP